MVVGDNKSTATKNAGELMAISIAVAMQRYGAGRIARWSTSGPSLEAATLFATTIAISVAVAVTLDSPLCHAPPSHLPPNVDCRVIVVTIALATLTVALFAPCCLPLSSHSPFPTPSM